MSNFTEKTSWNESETDLYFFSMFTHHFYEPWQQVRDSMGAYGLTEGSEHLERAPSIVTRRTTQSRLQGHITELLIQVKIWQIKGRSEPAKMKKYDRRVHLCVSVGACGLPDLDSLKTNTTCRRKFVSCPVLFKVWFFGEMSSWHHSGPYVLQSFSLTERTFILFHTWSTRW